MEIDIQDRVAIKNPRVIEIDVDRPIGARTTGDHDVFRSQGRPRTILLAGFDGVRVQKTCLAANDRNVVAIVECRSHLDLSFNDGTGTSPKFGQHEIGRDSVLAEQHVVVHFRHLEDGETERLAGDGASMSAISANRAFAFDDRDASTVFHGLHRGSFAAGAGTDHNDIIFLNRLAHENPFSRGPSNR